MPKKDPRIDTYIAKSADFAKPILRHLRHLVHAGCPDVEETIKWSHPTFMHQGMLGGMAAFKQHCAFGFWKLARAAVQDVNQEKAGDAMGQFGRLTSLADLPPDQVFLGYVKEAARLNEQGIKLPRAPKPRIKKRLAIPADLAAALKKNKPARETFEKFSPSHKNEYIDWITEAKREETRVKRLATTIAWLSEGKPRNWKYMNC